MRQTSRSRRSDDEDSGASSSSMASVPRNTRRVRMSGCSQEARSNKRDVDHYKILKQTYYDRRHELERDRKERLCWERREPGSRDSCPRCRQEAAGSSVITSSSSCMSARCRNRRRCSFESPRPSRCPQLLVAKCSSMRPEYPLCNSNVPYPECKGMPPICTQKSQCREAVAPSCTELADTMTHYVEVVSPSYRYGDSPPRSAKCGLEVSNCPQTDDAVYYPVYFYDYPRPCDWSCTHRGRRPSKRRAGQRQPRSVVIPKKTVPSRPICPMLKSYYRDLLNNALPTLECQCNFCQSC